MDREHVLDDHIPCFLFSCKVRAVLYSSRTRVGSVIQLLSEKGHGDISETCLAGNSQEAFPASLLMKYTRRRRTTTTAAGYTCKTRAEGHPAKPVSEVNSTGVTRP